LQLGTTKSGDLLCGAYSGDQVCVRESALQIARAQKDRQTEAAVLGSLGNAYLLMGEYNQAISLSTG